MKRLFVGLLFCSLALLARPVFAAEDRVNCVCRADGFPDKIFSDILASECAAKAVTFDSNFNVKCTPSYPGYCWCKTGPNGVCENHTNYATGNLIKSQSDCNFYCSGRGATWSVISYDTTYINHALEDVCNQKTCWCKNSVTGACKNLGTQGYAIQETCSLDCSKDDREWQLFSWDDLEKDYNEVLVADGGCKVAAGTVKAPGVCWCKVDTDCKKVQTDASGKAILDEASCRIACVGVTGSGRSMLLFDVDNGGDYSQDTGMGCNALIDKNDKDAADAAEALEKINRLKVDAKAKLSRMNFTSAPEVIGQVIKFFSALMGTIAFALYIYAGGLWMTASGNEEQITKAKNILVWATMGVGVMLASYILVKFVLDSVLTG